MHEKSPFLPCFADFRQNLTKKASFCGKGYFGHKNDKKQPFFPCRSTGKSPFLNGASDLFRQVLICMIVPASACSGRIQLV
ncbi:MAG TPA: hypothetical protein DCG49_06340 [Ruminococcus sp.]|nr:hypothetical protein [Ruminococcus sp.]